MFANVDPLKHFDYVHDLVVVVDYYCNENVTLLPWLTIVYVC